MAGTGGRAGGGARGEKRLPLPLEREAREALRAGDRILLSGRMITARDQAHRRLVEMLERGEPLPVRLAGETVYYAGPSPAPEGRASGSVGPTTAARMDPFTPRLAAEGLAACIGKGPRSAETRRALRESGVLYLVGVGGAAALLGSRVRAIRVAAFPELGPEAVYELEVEDFPVIVGYDLVGGDVFSHLENI
ncbi:MAG: fumarate hydratase C-terminal domain-containing protein [Actinobacteria bacterium]|nr:fumarate hydratase C-terminal domain-containing protein [Actinomycetota bacterium]